MFDRRVIRLIYFIFICFLNSACSEKKEYIIPVDFAAFEKDFGTGLTQQDVNEIGQKHWEIIKENSLQKRLPETFVYSIEGNEIDLRSLISKKTLIVFTDIHCGWGMEGILTDLPAALGNLNDKEKKKNVICLVVRTEADFEDQTRFNETIQEFILKYDQVYIIDEKESQKINVTASPTRMYFDEGQVLEYIGIGVTLPENLLNELENN